MTSGGFLGAKPDEKASRRLILTGRVDAVSIPNRPAFRAQEVCEIAGVPSFVLRGWEAEFPDLGVLKKGASARVYRKADVEQVLLLKRLILGEGLTLAGARRRLQEMREAAAGIGPDDGLELDGEVGVLDDDARAHLTEVRRGLQWVLETLDGPPGPEFALAGDPKPPRKSKAKKK